MVQLTKFAIKRPVTIVLILVTIVYFGIQSLVGTRVELIPEMELPMLVMSTVYPGASPDDVAELITTKQEDAISTLSSVESVQSYSMENVSIVIVQYEYGTNIDTAYINLKKAVDSIRSDLPDSANEPNIMELDINSTPVVTLAVSGEVDENLYTYVNNKIVPEFQKLSSVGEVSVSGGQQNYVRVEVSPEKLEQYHLSVEQVGQLVGAANFSIPAGNVNVGKQNLDVSVGNDYDDMESLKNIPIALGNGNIIHLYDIANVYETVEDAQSIGRYEGEDIITVQIRKQQSATAIDVSQQVMKAIDRLKDNNSKIHYEVISDSSEMIQNSISDVFQTVVLAVLLSMIVLWLFCGDIRASIIIGISILSSVVLALISISAMGFSLNVISLTSLVFGIGMMVDNSINVLDGCFRAKEKMNYYDAAVEGSRSMIGAITGGSVTNCVVFVPLLIMKGLTGQLFTQLGFTVIFCLAASLFSAVALVPLCFYKWHPKENENAPVNGIIKGLQNWYRKNMPKIVPKTGIVLGVTVALLVVSVYLGLQLDRKLLPSVDEGIVSVSIKTKPGSTVDFVNETVSEVEALVTADDNVDYYLLTYGSSGLSLGGNGDVSLTAYLKEDRSKSTKKVIDQWMEESSHIQNCTISMESGSSMGINAMSGTTTIEVDLQSTDYDALKSEADRLVDELRLRDDVIQVHSSIENAAPIIKVDVDSVKAQAEALVPAGIGSAVYSSLSGVKASTIRMNQEDIDVKVEYAPDRYDTVDKLRGMMIKTPMGTSVPLGNLADVYYQDSPQQIVRKDKQYQVAITMQPNVGYEKEAANNVKAFVGDWQFRSGVDFAANAMDESMSEELGALGGALVTAIFLIFIAMAIQFESPKFSLMIMVTIPFSLIGAFGLLFIADSPISMTSMLGFLMMVGNVVNNGILYVETVNQMQEDLPLEKALVESGAIRMRPILMTMTITVISELPNAFGYGESGALMQGSALVNVGGLMASTALMLLMIPTFYRAVYKLGRKRYTEPLAD